MLAQESALSIFLTTFIGALILLVVAIIFYAISLLRTQATHNRLNRAVRQQITNSTPAPPVVKPPTIEPAYNPPDLVQNNFASTEVKRPAQNNSTQNETRRNEKPPAGVNI